MSNLKIGDEVMPKGRLDRGVLTAIMEKHFFDRFFSPTYFTVWEKIYGIDYSKETLIGYVQYRKPVSAYSVKDILNVAGLKDEGMFNQFGVSESTIPKSDFVPYPMSVLAKFDLDEIFHGKQQEEKEEQNGNGNENEAD